MKRPTAIALPVFLLILSTTTSRGATADDDLTIRIVPGGTAESPVVDFDKPLQIVLTNTTDQPIHIRDPYTRNGYFQLSFGWVSLQTGTEYSTSREQIDDPEIWAMIESDFGSGTIEIAPRDEVTISMQLNGFEWSEVPGPNSSDRFRLSAEFESAVAASDSDSPVWTGKILSEPVTVEFVASRFNTPQAYLWSGFPARAVEVMEADPALISRRVQSDTPLHVAAMLGHAEVVEWLLQNGADVNETGFNGSTALHMADRSEVIALLLQHKPDLSIRPRGHGRTALQEAGGSLVRARDENERRNWQTIVEMYLDAGADYDIRTAIVLDDLERVAELLSRFPEMADDSPRNSPLRTAASLGRVKICRHLVEEYDVDVDDVDRGGRLSIDPDVYPIIIDAVAWPEIVRLLIENGADLATRISRPGFPSIGEDATSLHYAVRYGVPESIDLLIDHGVDIFARSHDRLRDSWGQTALELAAQFGKADNAIALLRRPEFGVAEESLRQAQLNECLLHAARHQFMEDNSERPELVSALLDSGADPDARNENGGSAIQIAAREIRRDDDDENRLIRRTIAILIENGATLDLFTAVAIGDADAVAGLLVEDPDSAAARSPGGYPALHFAVGMNDTEVVQLLLEAGVDVDIRNTDDRTGRPDETALYRAAVWDHEEIARLLIDAGADVNARNERRSTPLHNAIKYTNVKVARLLLEHGAQVEARDNDGKTPLDFCVRENGHIPDELRRLFREFGYSVDR